MFLDLYTGLVERDLKEILLRVAMPGKQASELI